MDIDGPIRRLLAHPDPVDLASLYAILDEKQHPYYEHRLAA
jgi:hypothetical protein